MKIRSDSLHAQLTRTGALDDFFAFVSTEAPSYKDMTEWLAGRGVAASLGAIHTIVTRHMAPWKIRQAIKAAAEDTLELPADTDAKTRDRIRALKFDLAMSDLSTQQQLALLKIDQGDRELANREQNARQLAVAALMAEAGGNDAAQGLLAQFLAALEQGGGGGQ